MKSIGLAFHSLSGLKGCASLSLIVPDCPLLSLVVPHCPSLSLVVFRCPSLSLVVPCCSSLSFVVPRFPSLSFVVLHCTLLSLAVSRPTRAIWVHERSGSPIVSVSTVNMFERNHFTRLINWNSCGRIWGGCLMVKDYPRKGGFWWWYEGLIWDLGKFLDLDNVDNDVWGLRNASFRDSVRISRISKTHPQRSKLTIEMRPKDFGIQNGRVHVAEPFGGSKSRSGQSLVYPGVRWSIDG